MGNGDIAAHRANLDCCPSCVCWLCEVPVAECSRWASGPLHHCMADERVPWWNAIKRQRREARSAGQRKRKFRNTEEVSANEAKPKKLSAYALFSKEKKPELQEKDPSKTGPEITTLIGALWKVRR